MDAITVLPVLAAGFAIPQFVPQILKLHRTDDPAGLSEEAQDVAQPE